MDEVELSINNVKMSCKIQLTQANNLSFNTDNSLIKFYNNFCVIKNKFTFIIFTKKKKGDTTYHVNITKIPNLICVNEALAKLSSIINEEHTIQQKRIENLTCLHQIDKTINLKQLYKILNINNQNVLNFRYRPEKFPGMFLSFKNCTVLLFSNGKIVIIGASNEEDAKTGIFQVKQLLSTFCSHA